MAQPTENNTHADPHTSLLRDLAHELRDALTPVASSIDLLRLRNFDPDASRTLAERAERALRRAFATVDAFVLADQCENGVLELETAPRSVNEILEATRERLAADVRERCVFTPGSPSATVHADLTRTAEVLAALLQYAGTMALPGTMVQVRALVADPHPQIRISSRIATQIAPAEDWFLTYRAATGGLMALRTARRIMALQQGGLAIVARVPGECEFVMTLTGDAAPGSAAAGPATPSREPLPAGARLIIVDDNAEVRRAYREALLPLGYTVTEAADADQALSIIEGERPDVALIDIHLPRINGYRLAQAMKARAGSSIRLIMLSGVTLDATTRRLSREAGFDDCLDKMAGPLALHALLQGRSAGR